MGLLARASNAIQVSSAGVVLAARIPVPAAGYTALGAAAHVVANQRGGSTGLVVAAALVQSPAGLAGPRVGIGIADAHRTGGGAGAVVGDSAAGPVQRTAGDARSRRRVSWSRADQVAGAAELDVTAPAARGADAALGASGAARAGI